MIVHIDTAWNTSYANAILFILSMLRVLCHQCILILVLMDFGETDLDISEWYTLHAYNIMHTCMATFHIKTVTYISTW